MDIINIIKTCVTVSAVKKVLLHKIRAVLYRNDLFMDERNDTHTHKPLIVCVELCLKLGLTFLPAECETQKVQLLLLNPIKGF